MSCRWAVSGPGVRVWEATDVIGLVSVSGGGGGVLIGWYCAKAQGHAELEIEKPRVKTLSYDFPKLHNSKTNSFCANVHLRQSFWKTVKVTKRSSDVTPKVKVSKIAMCLKFGAIPTIIYKVTAFWKEWHTSFVFDRPPSWKCQSNHTGFQTYPSPKWKMADPRNFGPIRAFFYRVIVLTSHDPICVPGQRSKVT